MEEEKESGCETERRKESGCETEGGKESGCETEGGKESGCETEGGKEGRTTPLHLSTQLHPPSLTYLPQDDPNTSTQLHHPPSLTYLPQDDRPLPLTPPHNSHQQRYLPR
ncbi:hypothetical protein Pcinc_030105 [Petrolisthes cinctipes]|uniref:Uncharacterized protein n=1 Tax=Petrolisthes cinctipes TaxID=88211 RepID=A0AAE1K4Y8_PETCI|nr:hypothetical protein Pcinc_030105 [Petrolisthes cinctipes]